MPAFLKGPCWLTPAMATTSKFRNRVTELGLRYCVGIQSATTIWPPGTGPLPPEPRGSRGPAPTKLRRDPDHEPVTAKEFAQSLPAGRFKIVRWRDGTKGKMQSRFAAERIRPANRDDRRTQPHPEEWLIIEWPKDEPEPTKYWLSTLPATTPLQELVRVAKLRWRIERDYEELKDEIGLNHYEGRGWRGSIITATLCVAAYAFLMRERLFPPRAKLKPSSNSQFLKYPRATGRAELPLRAERHEPTSIATMRIRLATALGTTLLPMPSLPQIARAAEQALGVACDVSIYGAVVLGACRSKAVARSKRPADRLQSGVRRLESGARPIGPYGPESRI